MEDFIEYSKKYGPWLLLLGYYCFWLNSQMNQIILSLERMIFELEQVRHLLEMLAHLR